MLPSVSIAFPCYKRATLLENTLKSIRRQNYPGELELVVVESGDDGVTKFVAKRYGAKYVSVPRLQVYPAFQSITEMWNTCLRNCSNEIAILQCAEVRHDSDTVIEDLVARVQSGSKILATPLISELKEDGSFESWYNHPTEGTRPGWVSGAGPHAFNRAEMMKIGGYEELFYGYGHEDDYFFYILRKNGWSIEYVNSAVCAHQWHPRGAYEPVTGYSNRALIRCLIQEIEDGTRPATMNAANPIDLDTATTEHHVSEAMNYALERCAMSAEFRKCAQAWLYRTNRHPDDVFNSQRTVANEKMGRVSEIGEMILEAAWGVLRAEMMYGVAGEQLSHYNSTGDIATKLWSERCTQRGQITHTWAARSLARAWKLMKSQEKS